MAARGEVTVPLTRAIRMIGSSADHTRLASAPARLGDDGPERMEQLPDELDLIGVETGPGLVFDRAAQPQGDALEDVPVVVHRQPTYRKSVAEAAI